MNLQTIGHHVFPASFRDIGTGVYHLAKGNATEAQCRKLGAGALRVSVAALAAIAIIASFALLPPVVRYRNLYSFNWRCRNKLRNSAMRCWRIFDSAGIL